MGTLIGETITYALEEAVEKQEKLNQILSKSNLEDQATILLTEQTELLEQMLSLCKRVY
jgi:ABC-type uncharacterized transport system ATPase subunit